MIVSSKIKVLCNEEGCYYNIGKYDVGEEPTTNCACSEITITNKTCGNFISCNEAIEQLHNPKVK
jgi:hypothetical protein